MEKVIDNTDLKNIIPESRAEQSRAEQSRADSNYWFVESCERLSRQGKSIWDSWNKPITQSNRLQRPTENNCTVIVIGRMDNTVDHTYESANRIYSCWGLCPTIPTGAGGGHLPKVLVKNEWGNQ